MVFDVLVNVLVPYFVLILRRTLRYNLHWLCVCERERGREAERYGSTKLFLVLQAITIAYVLNTSTLENQSTLDEDLGFEYFLCLPIPLPTRYTEKAT